jgi:hypothetical protein
VKIINKKADFGFSNIIMIVIAIIGGLLMITLIAYVLGAFTDPNRIEEGIGCRVMIQSTARIEEASVGIITPKKLLEACKVIETTIPRKDNYPELGGDVRRMSAEQFREVVAYDMAELINNAWWISGEGDRADYLLTKLSGIFLNREKCYLFYAVKIDPPRSFQNSFEGIEEDYLTDELQKITRSQIKGGTLKGDQRTILTYITLDNKGSGLLLRNADGSRATISLTQNGADALYGVAVGFSTESKAAQFFARIQGETKAKISNQASFILVAPYDEVASLCTVSN